MLDSRGKKFMQSGKAAPCFSQFPTYLRVAAAHKAQKFDLQFGVRREVGMAALGGHYLVAIFIFIPHQNRLPESSPGREQSFRAARFELTYIENAEIFRRKMFDTVACGTQIVQNNNLFHLQFVDK